MLVFFIQLLSDLVAVKNFALPLSTFVTQKIIVGAVPLIGFSLNIKQSTHYTLHEKQKVNLLLTSKEIK